MTDELYHYGVKGMKWGNSSIPEKRRTSYRCGKASKPKSREQEI